MAIPDTERLEITHVCPSCSSSWTEVRSSAWGEGTEHEESVCDACADEFYADEAALP